MEISPFVLQILIIILVSVAIVALVYVTIILVRVNNLLGRIERIVGYIDRIQAILVLWEGIPHMIVAQIKEVLLSLIPSSKKAKVGKKSGE